MRQLKLALILFLLLCVGIVYAQNSTVNFKDSSTPTSQTYQRLNAEYPGGSYPTGAAAGRWKVQFFKDGGDNLISNLNATTHLSTGDDVPLTNNNNLQDVTITPIASRPWNATGVIFPPSGTAENGHQGDKVFAVVYNSSTPATATKYMVTLALYTIQILTTQNVYINQLTPAGWSEWHPFGQVEVMPAVLVTPTPSGITGVGYAGQTLSWTAGTGTPPTGYKVYFGTDNPPTNIVNGTNQTGTTYVTGALSQNTTYYWQIIPHDATTDATGCPIWSFTTRIEQNPNQATNPSPANSASFLVAQFPYNQTLSWSAPETGVVPTGYKLYWNLASIPEDLGNVLTVSKNIPMAGTYNWQVVPYYVDPGTRSTRNGKPVAVRASNIANLRGDATGCPTWAFTVGQAITNTVDITSNPTDADIFVNGVDSGFNTPHQFLMPQGMNTTFTVQKAGYTWSPASFPVTNIQTNLSQDFTGTIITYTVDITSTPSNADIFVGGVDSGFNTPHQFVMDYGTSAVYTVQMAGYTWSQPYTVTNIQANAANAFVGTILTYTVDITSTPADADIFVGGVDSGFNTPHQFVMNYGTNATYTVQKAGYTFAPADFVVNNIQANTSQAFTGTIHTYTVDITSTPVDADIFVGGVDSGFNTPHQFVMNYGTSAVYTVQKAGFGFTPADLIVNNIQANVSQEFTGAVLTYLVDIISTPADADIYVNGVDSGFNTPHQFVMNYGTNATYTVQKAGYTWAPSNLVVTNIQANTSQNFTGTIITYTVDITSTPIDADIFIDGVDSGFNAPHQFIMNYGTSATYSVTKYGYTWLPLTFVVNNIQANTSQNFAGTQNLVFVDITSTPTDADIFVDGVDSGFNTPHQFALTIGSSAVYTVRKAGYNFAPNNLSVTNIQSNVAQNFVGTIITYTVDVTSNPTDADIFVNGVDSGFNTPHQFVMNYGTNAVYTVDKTGYNYSPANLTITNIQANTNQDFTGTLKTYTVDITSTPVDADIFVNGVDSGFNTPHQFVMNWGTSAVYTITKAGYTWAPANFTINNITANQAQQFIGTIITFTADITSVPADADIYIDGVDSGFNTPHQFVMNWGTNAVYTVQKAGYSYAPANFTVTNIQSNTNRNFTGTILTYTVDITSNPTNADIFVNGVDTGFNTPHQYVLTYGTVATYTVRKAGYSWTPADFVINGIQANSAQNFVGALLTYTVDITSTPADADIFVGGVDTGFNTPHQFVLTYGSSAVYTVQKAGYTWAPNTYTVTNIQANAVNNFVGTIITYTVSISSNPTGADIFVDGVDSGFNTPYQFVMNYGTNATYTIQKTGYVFAPSSFVISNIQSNQTQGFTGTLLTYTVNITSNPTGADIYNGGFDTGFNTPYQFTLSYGTSTSYSVKKAGYTWSPATYDITNIQANTSQNFTGTIITYSVDIASEPTNSDILIGGVDTGFNTPHTFVMDYGTSAAYTVQKTGYNWAPASFAVNNIHGNTSQTFMGTLQTFNVVITSTPTNADIFVGGVDTGFNTPHQFVLNYGSSATYTVQKSGYSYAPANLVVTNIQSNQSQNFVGTQLTYTVNITSTPVDADIYVGGVDTGFNTPHIFTMSYGTNAIYSVAKAGYTWAPSSYSVMNIHANATQNFTGTINSYAVTISSIPADADIFVGGVDTGFNTPHVFSMNYGTSATYSVVKSGYIWSPSNYVVSNIQANVSNTFNGILTALSVTPSNQNVPAQAGTRTFIVSSNIAWTVSEDVSWLSVSQQSGSRDGRLVVTYEANASSTSRVGQITITGSGLSRTVTVHQAGSVAVISVTPSNQNVTSTSGITTFNIISNTQWTVSENLDWLSVSVTSGVNNSDLAVTYAANPSVVQRVGRIVVTSSNKSFYITVTQAAAPVFLAVSNQNPNVTSDAGTLSLNVTSNVSWNVTESVSWLSVTPINGINNGTIGITYTANPNSVSRQGQIILSGSGVQHIITLTQSGASAVLSVTPPIQYVSNLEGNTSFTINSNTNWTISEDVEWLSVSIESGSNTRMFTVEHEANPTTSPRTGLITITWGENSMTVSVVQFAGLVTTTNLEATPAISIYPNPFVASTKVKIAVPQGNATVSIYSIKGQLVKKIGLFNKGSHEVVWNGKDEAGKSCSNGYYLVKYSSPEMTKTVKILMMKN